MKKRPFITNRGLQNAYNQLNGIYFGGRLPNCKCEFAKLEDDGHCVIKSNLIRVHKDFQKHPDVALLILIHEMAHYSMPEYEGDHGRIFHLKIDELYRKGAYDDLL